MFKPLYTISDRVASQLSDIAEIKAFIARAALLPEREIFLKRAAFIKMAHTSTSIEGNTLREYQVVQVASGKQINAEERQIREVTNYLSALGEVDKLTYSKKVFDTRDILKVHKIVVGGLVEKHKAGAFRPGPVYIVNVLPNGQDEIAYTPPSAKNVPLLVKELVDWLHVKNDVHPIVKAGLFHYQFETIHPFTDGNGRTGRLMTLLFLYQAGWDFKKILVLEDYYNRNRKAYYEALQTGRTYMARQGTDLSGWVEYFVAGFLAETQRVKDQVLSLPAVKNSKATRRFLDRDEVQIVDFAISLGRVTSSDVVDILSVPKRTAQAKLKKLEDAKILKKVGNGPATFYIVPK